MTTTELPIGEHLIDPGAITTASRRTGTRGDGSVLPQADRAATDVVAMDNDDEQAHPLTMHWSAVDGASLPTGRRRDPDLGDINSPSAPTLGATG